MPTPAEWARRAATSPGAFVPRTVQEADAEFDRLVRAGIPEAEADALMNQRLAPPSAWGETASQGLDFATRLGGNALDMGKALATAPVTMPLAAFDRARALLNGEAPANPLSPEVQRGFEVAKAEWARGHKAQALGTGARSTMDAVGLPATRAYEALSEGQYGSAAADLLTMGAQIVAPKAPVATARAANRALLGIPGKVGSLTAKGVGRALPSRGPVLTTPAPASPTLPAYPTGTSTAYWPPTAVAKGAPLPTATALPAAQQGAAMNALMRQRLAADLAELEAARAPARAQVRERIGAHRQAMVERQVAQADAARLQAQQRAAAEALRGRGDAAGLAQLRSRLGAAQESRLGTDVARADAGRRVPEPEAPAPDVLRLAEALEARQRKQAQQQSAVVRTEADRGLSVAQARQELAVQQSLTTAVRRAQENLARAQRTGDRLSLGLATTELQRAEAALAQATSTATFLR